MASPQLEDGYTCIAHELLEQLCRVNLSKYESRVLLLVIRKTYGHHKKTDRIALSIIAEGTGLDKGNAGRALRSLRERNIIAAEGNQIGVQKNHEKWLKVSVKTPPVSLATRCLQRPRKGVSRDLNSVVSRDTTKDIKIKDTVKAKPSRPTDPRVKEFIDWFKNGYQERFAQPYHVKDGKDGRLVKSLLRTFDLPELKRRVARLWESDDPFISGTDRGIGILANQINKLASALQPVQPKLVEKPPADLTYAHG